MEFLVRILIRWPADKSTADRDDLVRREASRAAELAASGNLVRLWQTLGAWGNVGIWQTTNATELQALLSSLPLYPWMDIDVEPLAEHPSDPAQPRHDRE